MTTDSLGEGVDLINACYEQHQENEARWEIEDRMGEAELMYYRAVQRMDSAVESLRGAADRLRGIDEPVTAKFCEEKASLIERMRPVRIEFMLASELLKKEIS